MRIPLRFTCIVAATVAASVAVAWLLISLRPPPWESKEYTAFAVWSFPLGLLVGSLSALINRWGTPASRIARFFVIGIVGIVVGSTFAASCAYTSGGYVFAFDFPVGLCWIAGAIAGFSVGRLPLRSSWRVMSLKRTLLIGIPLMAAAALWCRIAYGPLVSREVYLIPEGYVGQVAVVWHHPDGGNTTRDDSGAVVYSFDGSGILRLRDGRPSGWTDLIETSYYYIDSNGVRTEIERGGSYDYRGGTTAVEVYKTQNGGVGGVAPDRMHWYTFCVGVPSPGNACAAFFEDWERKVILGRDRPS